MKKKEQERRKTGRPKLPLHDWLVLVRHGTISLFRHCGEAVREALEKQGKK